MLANDLAKPIADLWAAIISIRRLRWELARPSLSLRWLRERTELLDRADADTICLAQGAIHSSGFRNSEFSPLHEGRDVRRIGIAITYEPPAGSCLINSGFESPP